MLKAIPQIYFGHSLNVYSAVILKSKHNILKVLL